MKPDNELNALIAERVMGWKRQPSTHGSVWHTGMGFVARLPNYCTDPAAWGALFVWLASQGQVPGLEYDGLGSYAATVGRDGRVAVLPGRALVLATLAAYGVEVNE